MPRGCVMTTREANEIRRRKIEVSEKESGAVRERIEINYICISA